MHAEPLIRVARTPQAYPDVALRPRLFKAIQVTDAQWESWTSAGPERTWRQDERAIREQLAQLRAEHRDLDDQIAAMELDGEDEDTLDELEEQAEAVQEKINRADGMLEVNMARLTFNRMMDSVNHALQCQLTGEDEFAEPAGCGSAGGCGGCTGCGSAR